MFSCFLFGSTITFAQDGPDASLLKQSSQARDLQFPTEPSSLSFFSTVSMAIYRPDGKGPFPGLVLFHQCGGLGSGRRPNQSMLDWAKEAVSRGYVAFLIDSLGPRGVDTVCYGPKGGVNFARGVKDALQAAEHLRKFEFVDKTRVALAGYSWGAMVGVLASSKRWGTTLAPGERFNAVVSFYPGCFTIKPQSGKPYEIVESDIDRPLLVLMGESDTETPAAECIAKLEAVKGKGAAVEWHVYPQTTHCWDCRQLDGFSKTDVRGSQVTYRYDEKVTRDSTRRMFEFLEKNLRPKS
jgi:dienelactone hydrolase